MVTQWILTAISTGAAGVALWYALQAQRLCLQIGSTTARLIDAEGALESLRLQHQKLAGRFYATLRGSYDSTESFEAAEPASSLSATTSGPPGPPCENWQLAQIDGPLSRAAACGCGYCEHMRASRARTKAALTPHSHAERVDAIKRGRADGVTG